MEPSPRKVGSWKTPQAEHQKVKTEADKTYRLYLDGSLTSRQFKGIYQPLDARKCQIEDELPRIQAEIDVLKVNALSQDHIMSEARDLHGRWPHMPPEARRAIVEQVVKDITIEKDSVAINLYYLPTCGEMTIGQRTLLGSLRRRVRTATGGASVRLNVEQLTQ